MNDILNHLRCNFVFSGIGTGSHLFEWSEFEPDDIFYTIPGTRYFAVWSTYYQNLRFFGHTNNEKDIPNTSPLSFIPTWDDSSPHAFSNYDIYYYTISPDEAVKKFGKKYKFLLYYLDLIK